MRWVGSRTTSRLRSASIEPDPRDITVARPRGIAWFKDSASEHLAHMYALKALLERYGHFVDVLQESRIGYVVWEDAHQVIAEPFKDTRTG